MARKKRKLSIADWFDELDKQEWLRDVEKLSLLLYYAAKRKSEIDVDVKFELVQKLFNKLEARRELYKRDKRRHWNGCHWRGVRPLYERIAASYGWKLEE